MKKQIAFLLSSAFLVSSFCFFDFFGSPPEPNIHSINIPPRFQWDENKGYCGEVSLISAGLYFGQYISQYDARALATKNTPQNQGQLLIGINDTYAAQQMHLNFIEWNTGQEQNTDQFLAWVKQNVVQNYPVAIGIYTNEYLFYVNTDPNAGDKDYDHIVPVTGIASNHPLSDPNYYPDDTIYFNDNGLWGSATNPPYYFNFPFGAFQATRQQANAQSGPVYSLTNDASNYGIAITGVMDLNGDTVPVRVDTNVNHEVPEIAKDSSTRPAPMPLTLTITISGLEPNVPYHLYRYNDMSAVPNSQFNANAKSSYQNWNVQIASGSTYTMTQQISSDEVAAYRCVKSSAP